VGDWYTVGILVGLGVALGVAVQTEQGLVVPVVRGCEGRSVEALDAEVRRLAEGARAGMLKPEELRGSTFTVTSAGKLAGLFQTPIVNHPEVAILSIGRIVISPSRTTGRGAMRCTPRIATSG
jgi:2-oxoisovalerate dehydrogenase E2 component (dihydrolipoyl transacylase)